MKFMSKYFKSIDQFGAPIQLNYKKSYTLKTHVGAVLTLVAGLLAIVISYVFARDIVTKGNVQISYGKVRRESNIYLKDFPISLMFVNGLGKALPDINKYLTIYASTLENSSNSTHDSYTISSTYEVTQCNASIYGKNEELVRESFYDGFTYCIKYDSGLKFSNDFASTNSTFLSLRIETCNNSTRDKGEKCKSKDEITKFLDSKVFCIVQFIDTYVQPTITDNPYNKYLFRYTQKIALNMFYRNYFRIINTEIKVDNGWISEDIQTHYIKKFESLNRDIDYISSDSPSKYIMTFESPRLGDEYNLKFIKLQNVIANIGGIMSIVATVLKVACEKVSEISFYLQESKDTINFADSGNEDVEEVNENKDSVIHIIPYNLDREIGKGVTNITKELKISKTTQANFEGVDDIEKSSNNQSSSLGTATKQRITKREVSFTTYLTTYLSCKNKNKEKRLIFESILEYFKDKLDITTIMRLSKEHDILKTIILGSSSDEANEIFKIKTELEELINLHKIHQQKEKDDETKENEDNLGHDKEIKRVNEERQFQKTLKKRLTTIQGQFGERRNLN